MDKKLNLIKAFRAHALGQELILSDSQYDHLLKEVLEENPGFNIYDYSPRNPEDESITHRSGLEDLTKEYTHELTSIWSSNENEIHLPKYDGSSIVIYYTLGKLDFIASMGDKVTGVNQTEKFKNFVPQEVSENISSIRCECLVDIRHYENARGKANGLVNAKYLQDEVEELCSLVAFESVNLDGSKLTYEELRKELFNKEIVRSDGRPKFMVSRKCEELTLMDRGICGFQDSKLDFQFAIDGVVLFGKQFAYKYDYLHSAKTKVIDIEWGETDREGFFPTLVVEETYLDGKTINRVSSNGIATLIDSGLGVGAEIEIAFSGATIPQIVEVLTPVEPTPPTCPYCGEVLEFDSHMYGATLKCTNTECKQKYDIRAGFVTYWISELGLEKTEEYVKSDPIDAIFALLNVPRLNYESRILVPKEEIQKVILDLVLSDKTLNEKCDELTNYFNLSELMYDGIWYSLPATEKIIKEIINGNISKFAPVDSEEQSE